MRNNFKRFLSVALVLMMALTVMTVSAFAAEETVAKIGDAEYATLAAAISGATAGNKITLLDDVTEDVTISKNLTIDGAGKTYTGKMTLKADTTIKNVNFDGKGYNGYAVETRGADYLTIDDCTAKNYGYGFVQLASGTALTTVKNVTVSNMNYGVKVDYSNKVVIENADITANVAGILNSNFGPKTITVKDSNISIIGTWVRDNITKSTFLFEGANTVNQFLIDESIDTLKLAEGATLAAAEGLDVTTDVADSYVAYKNGVYSVESNTKVAAVGGVEYKTLAEALAVAKAGDTITLLDDVTEDVTISKNLTIDGAGKTYTGKMTLKADTTIKNVNFDGKGYNGYAVETRGADYLTIDDCTAKNYGYGFVQLASGTALTTVKNVTVSNMNYGVKVDYSNKVVIENADITANVAGILNSNFGPKTITVKDSNISIIGTWVRDNITKSTFLFEGANTVDEFVIDANIDTFKLAEGATLAAPAVIDVTTDVADGYVTYENGVYSVVVKANVAAVGGVEYKTLAEAITAAAKGATITLLADVNENVTLSKNLTINGNGNKYTGKMTANDNLTVTVKNVNFVNGGIAKTVKSAKGNYTVKDCTFDGEGTYDYPLLFKGASTITVENCAVKDYLYSFLYVSSGTNIATVKNVTVEDCPNYAVYFASGVNTATFENLTVKNSNNGFLIDNTSNRSFTIKNCNMENVGTAINHSKGTKTITCTANGVNDFGGAAISKYVKLKAAAQIGTKIYGDLKTAIADAKDGDVITIVADYALKNSEAAIAAYDMYAYIAVTDKKITIDLNGKKLTAAPELDKNLLGLVYVGGNGQLTLKDSSAAQTGSVVVTTENTKAYSLMTLDSEDADARLYIESGNYYIDRVDAGQSMIYANDGDRVFVSGGNFVLADAKTMDNKGVAYPWIFNASGNTGINYVTVSGGTYNVDPTHHQGEVRYPNCYKAIENDGTWTVKYAAMAEIDGYGYWTIKDAVAAAKDGDVITVIADHELDNATAEIADYDMYAYLTVSDKKITIDLNGKTITANPSFDKAFYGVLVVNGTGDVTLTDSSADKSGAINVTAAEGTKIYSMLSTDGATSKLTIEDGNYYIDRVDKGYSMIYIAQTGTGYVNGGNFVLGNAKTIEREGGVMAPWIFNTAGNGVNFVEVTGGTYNTDPTHHWGEVKFPAGYHVYEAEAGLWKVVNGPIILTQPTDVSVRNGEIATTSVVAIGDGLTYRWYIANSGSDDFIGSSIKDSVYTVEMNNGRDGRKIKCVITDAAGNEVTTDVVTLTKSKVADTELKILNEDEIADVYYAAKGEEIVVKLDVQGEGLKYKWYNCNPGKDTFSGSSITTDTYTVEMAAARNGRKIKCVITDALGNKIESKVITLIMK